MSVKCFMIEPTGRERLYLRRFTWTESLHGEEKCPLNQGYHNAMVLVDEVDVVMDACGYLTGNHADRYAKDDPRWPTACACGYVFAERDEKQVFTHELYQCVDQPSLVFPLDEAPVGAIWDAWWMRGRREPFVEGENPCKGSAKRCGPDGLSLVMKLPNGHDWFMDGPSSQGEGWTRTGTPPVLTARPSILANQGHPNEYHGFLTNGYLERC